jgi:hypothetical protein
MENYLYNCESSDYAETHEYKLAEYMRDKHQELIDEIDAESNVHYEDGDTEPLFDKEEFIATIFENMPEEGGAAQPEAPIEVSPEATTTPVVGAAASLIAEQDANKKFVSTNPSAASTANTLSLHDNEEGASTANTLSLHDELNQTITGSNEEHNNKNGGARQTRRIIKHRAPKTIKRAIRKFLRKKRQQQANDE